MKFELCDYCSSFTECKKIEREYICLKCLGEKPKGILSPKLLEVVKAENKKSHISIIKENIIREKIEQSKLKNKDCLYQKNRINLSSSERKTIYETLRGKIIKCFDNREGEVLGINDLVEMLNIPKANISYSLFFLRQDGIIHSRHIYDFVAKKRYSIYSNKLGVVDNWRQCEIQQIILNKLEKTTKLESTLSLSKELNVKRTLIAKSINRHLKPKLKIYKVASEKFFVLKNRHDIIDNVQKIFPTSKEIC
jgi:DNA-binding transcriptional ArsR family regulator